MKNIPDKIITHTSASSKFNTAQDIHQWHKERWNGYNPSPYFTATNGDPYYVGYHYVIEWDGKIVQCRAHSEEGVHCQGQNFSSIGVCFVGNGDLHYPSTEQKKAWQTLYKKISAEFPNITPNRIYPHRKYANKTCHGSLLSDDYYTLVLGEERKPDIKELQERIRQLKSQLVALLKRERMKG